MQRSNEFASRRRLAVFPRPLLFPLLCAAAAVIATAMVMATAPAAAAAGETAPQEFARANGLYAEGKFDEARELYTALVRRGEWSPSLFYNLANSEWKLGRGGAAALNYERALALERNHPEARANLRFVRDRTGAKVEALRPWERLFLSLDANSQAMLAAVCVWAAIFCVGAAALRPRMRTAGLWLVLTASVLGGAYAFGGIFFAAKNRSLAVVTAKRAEARYAPADTASSADVLPMGSRVRVLLEQGAWTYCELPGRSRAWIATNALERVRLRS